MIVNLSAEAAMEQASMTAKTYMLEAVTDIDDVFGKGYAGCHPELVGAYMITAALDFHATATSSGLQGITQ
jgi:hypothetical protein